MQLLCLSCLYECSYTVMMVKSTHFDRLSSFKLGVSLSVVTTFTFHMSTHFDRLSSFKLGVSLSVVTTFTFTCEK